MARISSSLGIALAMTLGAELLAAWADEPFDYFRNSWNMIGLKDYKDATRVTPDNQLLLADGRRVRIRFGRQLTALDRLQTKRLLDGWLPVVLLEAEDGPIRYQFTLWATPLPSVEDWKAAFDWPTEGENFLNWVLVKVTNVGKEPARAKVRVEQYGPHDQATSAQAWSLGPGRSAEGVIRFPFAAGADRSAVADGRSGDFGSLTIDSSPAKSGGSLKTASRKITSLETVSKETAKVWLERTCSYWRGLMDRAARIEVPCRKATETLLAAHVCQLLAADHGELHGGEGFYDQFYIRDGGYQIMELEEAGLGDAAAKAVAFYLKSQRPDGRFETQKNQFDANGQALWVLWQYYKITGDRKWLEKAFPQMLAAVHWTMKARREAPADSPFAGLLPNAPADGEYLWDGKHHIVGYDLWNLRGLLCTADAARILGRTGDASELTEEAKLYRQAIDAAWKKTGVPHFPPSWEKDGTHWGNTETLWPVAVCAANDPRVSATILDARKFHGGGFVEGTIRWLGHADAIHPYLSAYTTMASLARGEDEQVAADFYWYLLHSTAAHAFPEGIYYRQRFAWNDTIPHVTGASNYALMLRHMLIDERGGELHLLSAVPDWWLAEGNEIRVQRAPTHFGQVNFVVHGTRDGVRLEFDQAQAEEPETVASEPAPAFSSAWRQRPQRIVLHLPKSRPLINPLPGVEVAERLDQRRRWDFSTVVKLYEQNAPPVYQPIEGLVTLPLESPLSRERCVTLDLALVANTDPLTAPFGVQGSSKGRLLFKGMPVGDTTVAGVPFRILDPANNGGRGLVVLDSDKAPANVRWPKSVEIPVKQRGKRIFFLGNVHGWSTRDAGTGPWGAVGQYVIHYADGQTQVVPLISGRTIDDWSSQPRAEEVFAGLRGEPWHLNVLGVMLHPKVVDKVVFEDLGTSAAPLLAAVTFETTSP